VCLHREDNRVEVMQPLPTHPNPEHVSPTSDNPSFVLPSSVAELVLERLELPANADKTIVHVGEAFGVGEGCDAMVRAIWFTPLAVDTLTNNSPGTHEQTLDALYDAWVDMTEKKGSRGAQPASGRYVPLGVGVLTGSGRESLEVGDGRSVLPFPRNPVESDAFEPLLSDFISDVSEIMNLVLPGKVLKAQTPLSSNASQVENAYQYPKLRNGAGFFRSHQVVIRGPRHAGLGVSNAAMDEDAYMSVSDLHVDTWDGGGELGACTVHTCQRAPNSIHDDVDKELLRCRGLAVFPKKWGGRGVHVVSMVPGWNCAILMRTCDRMHGSVVPSGGSVNFGMPSLKMMRIVTFPMRRIERLVERLDAEPDKIASVMENSHAWVRHRMECMNSH
jgi:hypothetical protein